jgi:hypothetical protein
MEVSPSVDALKNMGTALEGELRSLLAYYGENPDSPDAPKPEDFFGLVASFSSSLQACLYSHFYGKFDNYDVQKCALEVHDAETKRKVPIPKAPAAGNRSVGRGEVDLTIRSMRDGKRRARPQASRPLSRIFLDGSSGNTGRPQSRLFE